MNPTKRLLLILGLLAGGLFPSARLEAQSGYLTASDVTLSACTTATVEITATASEMIAGLSFGLRSLDPLVTFIAPPTLGKAVGNPGFVAIDLASDGVNEGVTYAVIVDFAQMNNLEANIAHQIAVVEIAVCPNAMTGEMIPLEFTDDLIPNVGTQPVPSLLTLTTPAMTVEVCLPAGNLSAPTATVDVISPEFIRGDIDGNGSLTIGDPIGLLNFLFQGTPVGHDCAEVNDVTGDGTTDIADPVSLLSHLFSGGPPPAAPFPACAPAMSYPLGCRLFNCP